MAVTDLYVAQYLLSATLEKEETLRWISNDSGAYRSTAHGVDLEMFHTHTMGWSGLCLSFRNGDDMAYIEEPKPSSFFGRNYRNEEDQRLAEAMQALADAVASQCGARRMKAWDLRDSIRESLYRQVLFGKP
ncbi:MAG TPA: hypothetical protein VGK29_14860 [Paludibaculum sp.]|jgi:hypothetical protein